MTTQTLAHFPSATLEAQLHLTEGWIRENFRDLTEALVLAQSEQDVARLLAMGRRCEDLVAMFATAAGHKLNALQSKDTR